MLKLKTVAFLQCFKRGRLNTKQEPAVGKTGIVRTAGAALTMLVVAGCASAPPETAEQDWTNRACESPAFADILGNYSGSIGYRDEFSRACQWNTEVAITGTSEGIDCKLSGTISATPDFNGNSEYLCAGFAAPTRFVVGLSDENLNRFGPSSVIVHMNDLLPSVSESGINIVNPIAQFEALTAFGGKLTTDAGYVLVKGE